MTVTTGTAGFGPLVDVTWLQEHLTEPATVIFDTRFVLTEPDTGRKQYLEGHIPGAIYLDLKGDLSSPPGQGGGRHPLPDPEVLAGKLRRAGVSYDSNIVVYDSGTGQYAARAWWVLEFLGLDRVAVLDGGYTAWVQAGGPVATGSEDMDTQRTPGNFQPHPRTERVRDRDAIRAWVERRPAGSYLVDARAPERYRGEVEPYDPIAGHIPGAINMDHNQFIGPDGRWRSPAELAQIFERLSQAEEITVYCGSGVSACANLFAMRLAGLNNTYLYPGSWSDWCQQPNPPVATGDES